MIQSAINTYLYRLGRAPYRRTNIWGWLLLSAFLVVAAASAWLGVRLLSTYAHAFTPYLKWQDALVALCWYITFTSLGGCVLIVRFLYALRKGYHKEMLVMSDDALIVRDLSHENLSSIFWLVSTALSCFVAALVGLLPEMLLGWTLQLSYPLLAVFATIVALVLSIAGLAITLPALIFVVVGLVGSISFCRNMGSPHLYRLTSQASLSIDGFVLTIIYPDAPEAMIDLNLLNPDDQLHLLHLLHQRWMGTQGSWNPDLGDEIEAALAGTSASAVLI
jgi:hypothetical protein